MTCYIVCLRAFSIVCTVVLLSSCMSLLTPKLKQDLKLIKDGEYVLDKAHTTVLFKLDHMGFSTFVGRFNSFDASLNFDPIDIEKSSLEATIEMTSVDVNNENFERSLKGRFWFDTENFPQAYFKTTSAKKTTDQDIEFQGDLTFLGETQPMVLDVHINGAANNLISGKYTLGFSASTRFLRSDFGLGQYLPTIGDKIELEIHAEFQRK